MATRRQSVALLVVSAAILFDALDLSITQIALPAIDADLHMGPAALQWVPNAYVLAYGGLLLLGGRLSDRLGRRKVFVAGLTVFAAMSLVCGIAPSAGTLVGARAIQGVGAALTVPAAVSIIATTFAEGPERNRALGAFGASASAGFSVGLVLGGVLTDALSWRWIFLVKVPVVLVAAGLALRAVDADGPTASDQGYDVPGALTSVAGVSLAALAITQLAHRTLSVAAVWTVVGAAVASLTAFALLERRTDDPLLPSGLLAARTVRITDLASLTVLAAPFGLSFVVTLWLQDVLDHSALHTGLALLPGAALSVLTSRYLAPVVVDRLGLRVSATGALVVVALGFLILLSMGTREHYLTTLLPATLVCLGLGMGVAYPAFTVGSVAGVDEQAQGVAAGVQNTALQIGGGIGLALVSAAVNLALPTSPTPAELAHALRVGALVGAALPLLGAAVVFGCLRE
jgi:EmrB/QacA subfamily drug resistance transporter